MVATVKSPSQITDAVLDDPLFQEYAQQAEQGYFHFKPRPDQPLRFDQQTAFLESKTQGVKILLGGNGAGTTTTGVHALCEFMLTTPPPRHDTPIWFIAPNLEQCMETAWKEKMIALGHMPTSEVDWDRIVWWKPRKNLPFSVPLKPWPDRPGKNWSMEFRGWKQGRESAQARSIGGFMFIEQAPFDFIEETLRGCREYDFGGNKIVEFTPVDPNIGTELLDMIEDNDLPPDWEVYYLNTECAMEAGHVTESWFNQFFATIPKAMRETRMTGKLPKWQGLIYDDFAKHIHVIRDDEVPFSREQQHRRGIDWGAGPSNPFGALWAFRNSVGQWFVYDEYKSAEPVTVHEHLKAIIGRWPWPKQANYGSTYADPSGAGFIRIAAKLSQYCPGYPNLPLVAASNDVLPGIEHIQYLLQLDPALADEDHPDGQPRLYIAESCKELIREILKYRWYRESDAGVNPTDAKVAPVKKDDHLVDALRYLCFTESMRYGAGQPVERESIDAPGERHGVKLDRRSKSRLLPAGRGT